MFRIIQIILVPTIDFSVFFFAWTSFVEKKLIVPCFIAHDLSSWAEIVVSWLIIIACWIAMLVSLVWHLEPGGLCTG